LELLSDPTENFHGAFPHANYEDPNINVALPVFSIHGNHDDPSGEGNKSALDILQISGLINYYGKVFESDRIEIKPVLLQKGRTKLALYGMSNVRDERLFRTFRDGKVKFYQPSTQKNDWFNLIAVHQNHHAYTETGYLPETFIPDYMDLVVWGHEHECLIEPRYNPEQSFHVMQPGSSVATSLMPGEAVMKHVAVVSVTGKEFQCEKVRLKTVRPFIMKEIVLANEPEMKRIAKKDNNRTDITRFLEGVVNKMIAEADEEWRQANPDYEYVDIDGKTPKTTHLPLIRLRVEYTAPEGGRFDCENPQRFSQRFQGKVANHADVVQFHRKKTGSRTLKNNVELPEESALAQITLDSVKVEKLVREFLTAQSLTILPQNSFGDAVSQFVDKDDKHAMEMFVNESLSNQVKHLLGQNHEDLDEDDITAVMDTYRTQLEQLFAAGHLKKKSKAKYKPKPDTWESDVDGAWEDEPGALIHTDVEDDEEGNDIGSIPPKAPAARARGKAAAATRKPAVAPKKAAPAKTQSKKKVVEEDDEEPDDDVMMISEDDEEEEELFVKPAKTPRKAPTRATKRSVSPVKRAPAKSTGRTSTVKQTKLNFSQPATQASASGRGRREQVVSPVQQHDT